MPILTIDDHAAIRAAIDVSVTSRDLPDDVIAQEIYRPAAALEFETRIPGWEALDALGLAHARRAAIYLCAALLAPVTPVYTTESVGRWSGTRASATPDQRAAALRSAAEAEVAAVVTPGAGVPTIPLFIVGRGRFEAQRRIR